MKYPYMESFGCKHDASLFFHAPFLGLSPCAELRNCACVSQWSFLMSLYLPASFMKFYFLAFSELPKCHLSVYRVKGLVSARKIYLHCEVEVHTVYKRLFKKGLPSTQLTPAFGL